MQMTKRELYKKKYLEALIKSCDDINIKPYLIRDYLSLLSFFSDCGIGEYQELIKNSGLDITSFLELETNQISKTIEEYIQIMDLIISIVNNLEKIYQETPIMPVKTMNLSCLEYDYGIELLENFFKELGDDFYDLFEYTNKNNVKFTDSFKGGSTFNTSLVDKSSLVILGFPTKNEFHYFQTLAHEIGHCYEYKYQCPKIIIHSHSKSEIVPIFIQKLFNYYLYCNTNLKEKAMYHNMIRQASFYEYYFKKVKKSNELFIDGNLKGVDMHNYEFPWIIENRNVTGDINSCFNDYLYFTNDIIASNLLKKYINNPKEGLNLLKKIIKTKHKTSLYELLVQYGNIDNMKDLIRNASEYQKRYSK